MTVLAHVTAVGSLLFIVPAVVVMIVLTRRGHDQSASALERRRRTIARRAAIREYWTLERRDEGWVVVDARRDDAPEAAVLAPSPWAELPAGNGNGRSKAEVRDVIAALAKAHQTD